MTIKSLYMTATNTTDVINVTVNESHSQSTSLAIITAGATTLSNGDAVSVDLGYTTNHAVKFSGFVRIIERNVPEDTYTITAQGVMSRAVDFFIASENPLLPLTYSNILAEDLVGNLMALAGLTSYSFDPTSFTFAVNKPLELNLISSYDYSKKLADMLTWHLYDDETGTVYFKDRKPYVMGSDVSVATLDDTGAVNLMYQTNTDDLRNKIIVYGDSGLFGSASTSSPYLPAGFFKTTVVSSIILDTQSIVDQTATFNLTALNRLTTSVTGTFEGDPAISAREVITLNSSSLGINSDWYVFGSSHRVGADGYKMDLELRQ